MDHRPEDTDLGPHDEPSLPFVDRDGPEGAPVRIARAIARGAYVSDARFDAYLPEALRIVSGQFWTPIEVASRVADWIDDAGVEHVVDIGSGVGKLCVVAAIRGKATYVGVEQRERLVHEAEGLANRFGVSSRARFVVGVLGESALPEASAYYLYNPFGENLFDCDDYLDADVELSRARHARDIAHVIALLRASPIGTHLVTYNGFGGAVPRSYEQVAVDRALPNVLRMWKKTRRDEDAAARIVI